MVVSTINRFSPSSLAIAILVSSAAMLRGDVQFNRDVRSILAENCWRCHGPDSSQRQAGLRLDLRDDAIRPGESGRVPVVPGQPDRSELIKRVVIRDPDLRMPPAGSHLRLTDAQVRTLKAWIREGAIYQKHWAFEPVRKPVVPLSDETPHAIDAFVSAKLRDKGLDFAEEASPATLLRRISFDLTGLPPTLEEISQFEQEGYERTVDRLLASPHFGERMAVDWLDAARFADTNGYFGDKPRDIWLWRDWVINAFNVNMPYDQFTLEQIAGDLLPNATLSQRVATGFNRNHMSNNETGIIDEEYRVEYVVDRVDTTMTTWLGLTIGCAQCHDHKYDPVSQREYYELFAFFNTVEERGLLVGNNPPPVLAVPTPELLGRQQQAIKNRVSAEEKFELHKVKTVARIVQWEKKALKLLRQPPEDHVLLSEEFESANSKQIRSPGTPLIHESGVQGKAVRLDGTRHVEADLGELKLDDPWTIGIWLKPDGPLSCVLSKIEPSGRRRGVEVLWAKGRLFANLVSEWKVSTIEVATTESISSRAWHHFVLCYDGSQKASGLKVYVDGQSAAVEVISDSLTGPTQNSEPFRIGRRDKGLGYYGSLDGLRVMASQVDEEQVSGWAWGERIRGILAIVEGRRNSTQKQTLIDYYIDRYADDETKRARDNLVAAREAERQARESIPITLVMAEQKNPRKTFLLERGQYNLPKDEVGPGVPAALSAWPADAPQNRLGLAQWIVAKDNPLTARVAVNRLWKQCFGFGLVRSMNDFGTQGELPTHPELLDYLAAELQESGWNMKAMLRQIVTSETYRQSSRSRFRNGAESDPKNRLLARGPSFRLPMEMVRDQALAASGLLVRTIGGPSVKPWQPPGLWKEVSYNGEESYVVDSGQGLWRRSLYTWIKRQAPPPAMLLLDGPTREKCQIERPSTNTPLQSLLLLNDVTWIEASRVLAERILGGEGDDRQRIQRLWKTVLTRAPTDQEVRLLEGLLARQRVRFAMAPISAVKLLQTGTAKRGTDVVAGELASWTMIAHTILNLDEAIVRR